MNTRGKLVTSSLGIVVAFVIGWQQIFAAYAQTGLPIPATRDFVEKKLEPVNGRLKDVTRQILESRLQALEAREESIVGEQVNLKLRLPDMKDADARRIVEQRLATIEIERGKLQWQRSMVRDELNRL